MHSWVLNMDGASRDNLASGGGIIRLSAGDHVVNFFNFFGEGSSNLAETRALLDGLELCKLQNDLDMHI